MSVQAPADNPNLVRDIANVGRGVADVVFSPLSLLNEGIEDIMKRLRFDKEDRSLEIPTLATTARDIKEFFIDYHMRIFHLAGTKSETVKMATQTLLEKGLSWLNFFEIGKMVHDIISSKMATLARIATFAAITLLHTVPYLAISGLITGMVLLYQAAPLALLSLVGGAVFSVQLLQSYFLAKGVIRAGNILEKEAEKVDDKAALAIQMGAAKANNTFHEWMQTTRPISWFTTGGMVKRTAAAVGTIASVGGLLYASPAIAIPALLVGPLLAYKAEAPPKAAPTEAPEEKPSESA